MIIVYYSCTIYFCMNESDVKYSIHSIDIPFNKETGEIAKTTLEDDIY
jgi:hypothetical protein